MLAVIGRRRFPPRLLALLQLLLFLGGRRAGLLLEYSENLLLIFFDQCGVVYAVL
jgi:hypothetical protein